MWATFDARTSAKLPSADMAASDAGLRNGTKDAVSTRLSEK
jgi:hypothetical protein